MAQSVDWYFAIELIISLRIFFKILSKNGRLIAMYTNIAQSATDWHITY